MNVVPVGIVGASGYAGVELTRLVCAHPGLALHFATSDRWAGEPVERRVPGADPGALLWYSAPSEAVPLARGCEVVLLATPAEASLALAPLLLEAGLRVIDLSGAFRLPQADDYSSWYGFMHTAPGLLATAVYGLPELFRAQVPAARLVANPGCYPTAAILPLFPLLRAGLVDPGSLVINAASGVTGAGRKGNEDFSFAEIDGDFRAYRVLRHQHTPEIAQALSRAADPRPSLVFTPHLLPIKRGILCTTFARLAAGVGAAQVGAALSDAYRGEPFVSLAGTAEDVSLKQVVGTNRCQVGFAVDGDRLVLLSAIDNLVKGAAGQAVQNLNLMLGLPEPLGLEGPRGFHP